MSEMDILLYILGGTLGYSFASVLILQYKCKKLSRRLSKIEKGRGGLVK